MEGVRRRLSYLTPGATSSGGEPTGCVQYGSVPGCGVAFRLIPTASGPWQEQVLYSFTGGQDGASPTSVVLDSAGNVYGMTYLGGQVTNSACPIYNGFAAGCGVVFQLTPGAGGTWDENVIYSFGGGPDGNRPQGGLTIDSAGNLYGTTFIGGLGYGVVFRISQVGGIWSQSVLYSFTGGEGGASPLGLALNAQGTLFGSNGGSGTCGCGGCG